MRAKAQWPRLAEESKPQRTHRLGVVKMAPRHLVRCHRGPMSSGPVDGPWTVDVWRLVHKGVDSMAQLFGVELGDLPS